MEKNKLSIIVPAKNSESTIHRCLSSIISYVPKDETEIIVVINDSTDNTAEIVKQFDVTILTVPKMFVSEVRNVGAQNAKYPLIAFIDSDCLITENWYPSIMEIFENKQIGVTGSHHMLPEDAEWIERTWYRTHNDPDGQIKNEIAYIPAGNLVTRLSIFNEIGGYDKTLETGEDPDLCSRIAMLGYKIVEYKKIECIHLGNPKSFYNLYKREKWHGRGVRFKYANGKFAPVALSTLFFTISIIISLLAIFYTTVSQDIFYLFFSLPLFFMPVLYAGNYSKKLGILHFIRLTSIYFFYFLGRSAAFPVVILRLIKQNNN